MKDAVKRKDLRRRVYEHRELYLFLLPAALYFILFNYIPMGGIVIAFKNFKIGKGIFGSKWVGLKYFIRIFGMAKFPVVVMNTIRLSAYTLLAGIPLPIILALLLNTCSMPRLKKVVQTVTYAPHFISTVVVVAMVNVFFAPTNGIVSNLLMKTGAIQTPLMALTDPKAFPHLYVWSGVWQSIGWNSIIYLGALTGVDPSLHESAMIDGANKLQRILHIDLPCIMPTIILLLIMNCGSIMNVGFEKAFLMQRPLNLETSEVISTYVYKLGIQDMQYSMATAVGVFNSVINFALVITVNTISRRLSDSSLW